VRLLADIKSGKFVEPQLKVQISHISLLSIFGFEISTYKYTSWPMAKIVPTCKGQLLSESHRHRLVLIHALNYVGQRPAVCNQY